MVSILDSAGIYRVAKNSYAIIYGEYLLRMLYTRSINGVSLLLDINFTHDDVIIDIL